MNTPLCPVHNKPMRAGTKGSFYCTTFIGEGAQGANARGYCNYRPPAAPRPASVAPPRAVDIARVGVESSASLEPHLRVEALRFVGQVMQGSASYDTALMRDMAAEMLAWLRGTE